MKKLLILLLILNILVLVGCSGEDELSSQSSIISLPTIHTEQTANGYRNPALVVSSNLSSNSSDNLSSTSESKLITDANAYVASKNSKVFHLPDCSSVKRIKEENRGYSSSAKGAWVVCAYYVLCAHGGNWKGYGNYRREAQPDRKEAA